MIRNPFDSRPRSLTSLKTFKGLVRKGFARSRELFALVSLIAACVIPPQTSARSSVDPEISTASSRIDLSAIGYQGLSPMARLVGTANLTLDFVDDDHVLFTFNPKKLFTRHADCPPDHNDRLIDAVVFEISTGKVVRQTEWYAHDRLQYLWPLGSGRFLLRRSNDLYEIDSLLQEKLVFSSPTPLLWVTVSADKQQLLLETEDDALAATAKAKRGTSKRTVKIEFRDATSLAVQRVVKAEGLVNLEATSSGFADVNHNITGKTWLIRFGPAANDRNNITRVRSRCTPDVFYSSGNTMLVGRCAMGSTDYSISAFTVTGNRLWRQHWSEHRYRPVIRGSEDGSRFAVSTLALPASPASRVRADSPDDGKRDLGQNIQVLDTASGTRVLSVAATSALLQQNFSLSPDGSKLAVVRDSTIETYSLPAMSDDERAKYTSVKADVPGLYIAPATPPSEEESQEPAFVAAENEAESVAEDKTASGGADSPASEVPAPETPSPVATPVPGGTQGQPYPEVAAQLTFKVNTQLVAIDVVVTDAQGHPVRGLQQHDFTVAEDSKPQGVRYFKEVAEGEPAPPSPAPADKLPPNIFTNNSAAPESGAVTVILLDLLNTPLPDQRYAQEQLLKFLKNKPKGGEFALCTLSNTLRMIQGFTPDENLLVAAVNGKKGAVRTPPLLHSVAENESSLRFARVMAQDPHTNTGFMLGMVEQAEAEAQAQDVDMRMYLTLDAFAELARYLSGVPGRKNLIWLSASFPTGIFPGGSIPDPFAGMRNFGDHIRKTTNLLADSHVAVYPVDVRGTMTESFFSAANPTVQSPAAVYGSGSPGSSFPGFSGGPNGVPSTAGNQTIRATPVGNTPQQDAMQQFLVSQLAEHSTMDDIARGTGGKAFYNTNGIDRALALATEQGAHYYSLSYTPTNKKYDGRFRKIKLNLPGKKCHLAYRTGYYAVDPDAPSKSTKSTKTDLAMAAMQHGSPQSRQVLFAARVVPIGKPSKVENEQLAKLVLRPNKKKGPVGAVEMQHYGIDYVVTPSQLRFGAAPDGSNHGVLSFLVTSFDDDGRLLTRIASEATSDLKPDAFKDVMTGGFRVHQELDVPVAAVSLRMGVEDMMSSHIGTLEIPLPVKALPDAPHAWSRSLPEVEPD
jgi:VWFA-related protein